MPDKINNILFVVEGEKREMIIFNNLSKLFFYGKSEITPISVSAEQNIYMLYNIFKKDNFETDVVEVLREKVPSAKNKLRGKTRDDFSEIYFFFDFDEHTNNTHGIKNIDALMEMLKKFDNETEMGKLYISYPMVEAFRDYVSNDCGTTSGSCFCSRNQFGSYKNDSAKNSDHTDVRKYNFDTWNELIAIFIYKSSCLFNMNFLDRNVFVNTINPLTLFEREMKVYAKEEQIFIISSLPEFLIDYSEQHWNKAISKLADIKQNQKCETK